jgi:hypothetical protein
MKSVHLVGWDMFTWICGSTTTDFLRCLLSVNSHKITSHSTIKSMTLDLIQGINLDPTGVYMTISAQIERLLTIAYRKKLIAFEIGIKIRNGVNNKINKKRVNRGNRVKENGVNRENWVSRIRVSWEDRVSKSDGISMKDRVSRIRVSRGDWVNKRNGVSRKDRVSRVRVNKGNWVSKRDRVSREDRVSRVRIGRDKGGGVSRRDWVSRNKGKRIEGLRHVRRRDKLVGLENKIKHV